MSKKHNHVIKTTSRSKAQLQQELTQAHIRIAELETQLSQKSQSEHQLAQETVRVSEEKFRSIFDAEPEYVKQAELAMQQTNELNRRMIESLPCAFVHVSRDGAILMANSEATQILGLSYDALAQRYISDFETETFWEDGSPCPAAEYPVTKAILTGLPQLPAIIGVKRLDGSISWGVFTAVPVFDTANEIAGAVVTFLDITARKRAEDDLKAAHTMLKNVLDSTPDMIFIKDQNLRTIMCNTSFAKALGKEPAELLGHTDIENGWNPELVNGNPAKGIRGFVNDDRAVLAGKTIRNPYDPANVGDAIRIFDTHKLPLRDPGGQIIGVLGVARDITELKAAEAIQLKSEIKFRNIIDVSPVPYALNDSEGNITYLNPAFIRTFGYDLSDIPTLADWWPKAYPDEEYRQWVATIWQVRKNSAFAQNSPFETIEVKICCKNGTVKAVLVGVVALGEAFDGNHLVVLYDISELRAVEDEKQRLQNRLIQAQKMETVGRLAGGIAHDFNNMLTVILGNTEMALMETSPKQKWYNRLEEIYHAAGRSSDMTKQLLAFARKQPVTPKIIDLNDVAKGTLSLLKRLMHETVQLSWQPGPGLWPVRMDPTQVHQILVNLCVNARDAIVDHGSIHVCTQNVTLSVDDCQAHDLEMPGEYVLLSISDTGGGIAPDIQPSIFEPFFTTKPLGEGSGLGLSIVYGIVSQNNGVIEAHSTLGQGSTFKVYLPRYLEKPQAVPTGLLTEPLDRGKETVLLVDDEPAVLRLTTNMLEVMGYQVLSASTPSEALQLAQSYPHPINLLLSDVIMPEMNGYTLSHRLLTWYPQMKTLFMSGYTADSIINQHIDGSHFIQKPCSMTQLATRLRAILDET